MRRSTAVGIAGVLITTITIIVAFISDISANMAFIGVFGGLGVAILVGYYQGNNQPNCPEK